MECQPSYNEFSLEDVIGGHVGSSNKAPPSQNGMSRPGGDPELLASSNKETLTLGVNKGQWETCISNHT